MLKCQEEYMKGQEKSGIEIGDIVRVMRKAKGPDNETGWIVSWIPSMDEMIGRDSYVGNIFPLVGDLNIYGIQLEDGCCYPYYVFSIVMKGDNNERKI